MFKLQLIKKMLQMKKLEQEPLPNSPASLISTKIISIMLKPTPEELKEKSLIPKLGSLGPMED